MKPKRNIIVLSLHHATRFLMLQPVMNASLLLLTAGLDAHVVNIARSALHIRAYSFYTIFLYINNEGSIFLNV